MVEEPEYMVGEINGSESELNTGNVIQLFHRHLILPFLFVDLIQFIKVLSYLSLKDRKFCHVI